MVLKNTGNHFTWKKVTTLVNNIIVGKLWIDNVCIIKKNVNIFSIEFVIINVGW